MDADMCRPCAQLHNTSLGPTAAWMSSTCDTETITRAWQAEMTRVESLDVGTDRSDEEADKILHQQLESH